MANRNRALDEAMRSWQRARIELGGELREARLARGLTQAQVAAAIGTSGAQVSRLEHGRVPAVRARVLIRHCAAVGLRLWLKAYPLGGGLRDEGQAAHIGRFVERLRGKWGVQLEAPMPLPGDLRAVDVLLRAGGVTIAVEVITRLRDLQAQLRATTEKARDVGATRFVLVVAASHANRRALAQGRPAMLGAFDLDARTVIAALQAGRDPGRDAVILL
ncbi:MAG: helix-turn-helix domain-containing protein [Chloroflexota bacterium]|nr:helix-turn-helix domain-containing protein [Chloroflexota bacterium]